MSFLLGFLGSTAFFLGLLGGRSVSVGVVLVFRNNSLLLGLSSNEFFPRSLLTGEQFLNSSFVFFELEFGLLDDFSSGGNFLFNYFFASLLFGKIRN